MMDSWERSSRLIPAETCDTRRDATLNALGKTRTLAEKRKTGRKKSIRLRGVSWQFLPLLSTRTQHWLSSFCFLLRCKFSRGGGSLEMWVPLEETRTLVGKQKGRGQLELALLVVSTLLSAQVFIGSCLFVFCFSVRAWIHFHSTFLYCRLMQHMKVACQVDFVV